MVMRRAALLSLAAHLLIGALLLVRLAPQATNPPPHFAEIELIQQPTPTVGDNPQASGQSQADKPPAAQPPSPPLQAAAPAVPDAAPPPAPPATQPAPTQQALTPPVRAATDPNVPPPPPPRPPAATPQPRATAAPHATPPPPPSDAVSGPPADPPAIRLGEGGIAGTGLVTGEHVIPAGPDSTVHNRPPAYPAEAARMGEEGTVMLVVHVAPDGSASAVEVQETSGYERLDQAARDAVAHWHFRPAQENGAPIASEMPVRVRFVLKE